MTPAVLECCLSEGVLDVAIVVLVIVLFGLTVWIVKGVERLGSGRTS